LLLDTRLVTIFDAVETFEVTGFVGRVNAALNSAH